MSGHPDKHPAHFWPVLTAPAAAESVVSDHWWLYNVHPEAGCIWLLVMGLTDDHSGCSERPTNQNQRRQCYHFSVSFTFLNTFWRKNTRFIMMRVMIECIFHIVNNRENRQWTDYWFLEPALLCHRNSLQNATHSCKFKHCCQTVKTKKKLPMSQHDILC